MKNITDVVTVFRLFNSAVEDVGSMFLQNTGARLPEYMHRSPKVLDGGVLLNWHVLDIFLLFHLLIIHDIFEFGCASVIKWKKYEA